MAIMDVSAANAILKEMYGPDGVGNAAYEENPWFGMMPKKQFRGKHYDYPVKFGYASNRSRTGATALAKANASADYVEFNVPTVADHDAKSISKKAIAEVRDEGAFVDLLKETTDNVIKSLSNQCGADAFGHRGASRGQVGAFAAGVLTLLNPGDVTNIEVGQELRVSAANGLSGALRVGSATVTAVDRSAGTITTDADWDVQIAAIAVNDHIFVDGDFGLGRAGLADWVPDTTTGLATAYYGAVRAVDATRLAGSRMDATGKLPSQAIRDLASQMGREEGRPDIALCSWSTFNDCVSELHNKMEFVRTGSSGMDATVGFDGIKIAGARGSITLHADRSCPDDRIYLVRKEDWECIHSESAPVVIDDGDGNILSRETDAFAYDIRGVSFVNFALRRPVNQGVALL